MTSLPPPPPSAPSGTPGRQPGDVQDSPTSRAALLTILIAVLAVGALVFGVVMLVRDIDDPATDPGDDRPATTIAAPTSTPPSSTDAPATFGTGACAPDEVPSPPVRTFEGAPRECIDTSARYRAVVTTNHGTFTITLATRTSPITVNNFVTLSRWGYYDGTGCHRVIADFVVQCGRPGDDERAPGYTIPDELPEPGTYAIGTVAMANTGAPDSGGGQWFIVTGPDGMALPPSYSVVGTVTKGYDTTVTALAALADPAASNGVPPRERIRIRSIRIVGP